MFLIVSEHIQIPHLVGKLKFEPFCEVDDVKGLELIKSFSKSYREIKETEIVSLDLTRWTRIDPIKGKNLKDAIDVLSADQKVVVLNFIRELFNPPKEVQEERVKKILETMTIPELRIVAKDRGIEIPVDVTKKSDILALIKQV
jgi:hypothetical protein